MSEEYYIDFIRKTGEWQLYKKGAPVKEPCGSLKQLIKENDDIDLKNINIFTDISTGILIGTVSTFLDTDGEI